ncbi:MAG: LON peptidase substrate-binding domain-containing protein [Verrucomicrobiota bacterium]|jgi:Lon protease-like protein
MVLPAEVPVMTLPNAILFPQVMLPLFIYEPRYRKMLQHVLETERMFAVAMQKPGNPKGTPSTIAGLGLVRAAVTHPDGTSHIVLQGIARISILNSVKQRPFRVVEYRLLETKKESSVMLDALIEKVLDLVSKRFKQGFPSPILNQLLKMEDKGEKGADLASSLDTIIEYLSRLENPDQLADLVSCTFLSTPTQRQLILETVDLEARLKHLIHFLMADVESEGNDK